MMFQICLVSVVTAKQEQLQKKGSPNSNSSFKCKAALLIKRIPKKKDPDAKHCVLYKKDGGMYATHNTSNCPKYKKDGIQKKSFRQGQSHSTAADKKQVSTHSSFPQRPWNLRKKTRSKKHRRNISESMNMTAIIQRPPWYIGPSST
jgi:hypothetical protein